MSMRESSRAPRAPEADHTLMDLAPAIDNRPASVRCDARARCMVRVKFVSFAPVEAEPAEVVPEAALWGQRASGAVRFLSRVIGRLVAARP
jgi:hypothetical protein